MIVKRNRAAQKGKALPRMIVKRGRETVGQAPPRAIVRRQRRTGVQGRTARRWPSLPRIEHPRRWLWGSVAVAVVAGAVMGGAWVWRSPVFKVNHIEVTGNRLVATDSLVLSTGLLGESMFTADLAQAQQELYSYPLIYSVKVERDWPDTMRITVEERRAWGIWEQDNVRYTVDRDGVVLGTVPPPEGSPVIRSSAKGSLQQGDRVDYQAVDAAAEIYERLPRQLGTTVSEVAYLAGKGVQVTTGDGQVALLGDSSSINYKLSVWAALSREAQVRGINYTSIDLRYGNRPVVQ